MQKDIFKEDYFGTLMCVLVDESRKLLPTFKPSPELHRIQNDMCKAGSWIDKVPLGVIVQTVPQSSIKKLQEDALPEYRKLAANLLDSFINDFEAQGGRRIEIKETIEITCTNNGKTKKAEILNINDKYLKVVVEGTQLFIELFRDDVNIPYTGNTAGLKFEWQPKN
jgi:hypothetical protein